MWNSQYLHDTVLFKLEEKRSELNYFKPFYFQWQAKLLFNFKTWLCLIFMEKFTAIELRKRKFQTRKKGGLMEKRS